MIIETIQCDECGRMKGEANHWIKIGIDSPDLACGVAVVLGNLSFVRCAYYIDLCGQSCAMKHIAKLLGWSGV